MESHTKVKQMTRKLLRQLAVIALIGLALSSCYNNKKERQKILKIYNWADYIDEDVLNQFPQWYKEQTGEDIRIIYQTFDINEIMLTKIEKGHEDYDLACPSDYIIERMLRKNLLLPIDTTFGKTPNYIHHQSPYIAEQLNLLSPKGKKTSDYAVGYMWGTAGLLYNKKYVPHEHAITWGTLWNNRYKMKILMKDGYKDVFNTVLIYANRQKLLAGKASIEQIMNNYSQAAIDTVEKHINRMKPNIAGWEADFGKEMMTKNKVWLNLAWSGDAVWAIEEAKQVGVNLDYEVPIEGSSVWYDGWVIPQYAKNVKAASYFINYLCIPENALKNMETCGYVSSIATPEIMEEQIDETLEDYSDLSYFFGPQAKKIKIDKVQYPDIKVINRCSIIRDSSDRTQALLDMWSRVKGDNMRAGFAIMIFSTFVALIAYKVYAKIKKYKRNKKYKHRKKRRIKTFFLLQ